MTVCVCVCTRACMLGRTGACREEGEKFNVWVALLNLEAVHGTPSPDEALMATFAKAAPYCDQKRLYFVLLGACRCKRRVPCATVLCVGALCRHASRRGLLPHNMSSPDKIVTPSLYATLCPCAAIVWWPPCT